MNDSLLPPQPEQSDHAQYQMNSADIYECALQLPKQIQRSELPESLSWLPEYIGRDNMALDDLNDGFVLIQILSIVAPSAVDLTWYTTEAALNHPNLAEYNRSLLLNALAKSTTIKVSSDEAERILTGDIAEYASLAIKMRDWKPQQNASGVVVPTSENTSGESNQSQASILTVSTPTPWCWDFEYEPSEVSFKTSIRWLLMLVKRGCIASQIQTCERGMEHLTDMMHLIKEHHQVIPAGPIISSLTYGALYYAACCIIFNENGERVEIEAFLPEKEDETSKYPALYLETLQSKGFLDFRSSLKDTVKDMVADRSPFYESIHSKILENLIMASLRNFSTKLVWTHIKERFPKYSPAFAPYDIEDALLMWINTCALQLSEEYTAQQQSKTSGNLKYIPSTPPILPLFLESWTELDNFCQDFRDGRALSVIAVYYGIGNGAIDPYKVHPKRRSSHLTSGQSTVHLTLAYRIANLNAFERACSASGIHPPPWRPEELARAEGNISRANSANVNKKGGAGEGNSITTAFRSCLQSFLCDMFLVCCKIPKRQESRRELKISRKSLKEVSISSSKDSSRPDTALLPVAAENSMKVAGMNREQLASNSDNVLALDGFLELHSPAPVSQADHDNTGCQIETTNLIEAANLAPLKDMECESQMIPVDEKQEPINAVRMVLERSHTLQTPSHVLPPDISVMFGRESDKRTNVEESAQLDKEQPKSESEADIPLLDGLGTPDYSIPLQNTTFKTEVSSNTPIDCIIDNSTLLSGDQIENTLLPRLRPTSNPKAPESTSLPLIFPKSSVSKTLTVDSLSSAVEYKTTKLPEIFNSKHTTRNSNRATKKSSIPKLPNILPSHPDIEIPTHSKLEEHKDPASVRVCHSQIGERRKSSQRRHRNLEDQDSGKATHKRLGDSPPSLVVQESHAHTNRANMKVALESEEERQETSSFVHSLQREFLLNKQATTNSKAVQNIIVSSHKCMNKINQTNEYNLVKLDSAHFDFGANGIMVDEDDDAENMDSEPDFDVDAALEDNDEPQDSEENLEAKNLLALSMEAARVTFAATAVGVVDSDALRKEKTWPRPPTGPSTQFQDINKHDQLSLDDGYHDSSGCEDDDYEDIDSPVLNPPKFKNEINGLKNRKSRRKVVKTSNVEAKVVEVSGHDHQIDPPNEFPHSSAGFMTFPIPESETDLLRLGETNQVNEEAWERSKSKICQLKQKRSKARGLTDSKPSKSQKGLDNNIQTVEETQAAKHPGSKCFTSEPDSVKEKELEQNELRRRKELEQMDLMMSKSRLRVAQRTAEKEMALAAARAASTVSQSSSNSLRINSETKSGIKEQILPSSKDAPYTRKKPLPFTKQQSNRKIIKNALQVCLAGTVNEKVKKEVIEDLDASKANHFIILFRGLKNHAFKGLYSYDNHLHQVLRVYAPASDARTVDEKRVPSAATPATPSSAAGPNSISEQDVLEFYKYDSGSRSFKVVPTRSFGASVHAVALRSDFGRKAMI
ncbi:hypothetical protein BDR26DRAFT_1003689 [Obelidium mucronatum]|nr:hypothetical protein BDR26DRAFT_1003689 [Obelidium mucronatum]